MVETLIDELPDGVCMSDAQGRVLYMNPAAEHLLDVSVSRAKGKPLCELLCRHLAVGGAPECASTCELLRPGSAVEAVTFRGAYGPKEIATWKDFKIQRRSVWKNLRVRCLKSSAELVGDGRRLTIIEDVSADVDLEHQKEDWRQMIAHDLRSPLTSVYAALRIIQDSAGRPLPEGIDNIVDAAERSCRKMIELITLYLDVARLDAHAVDVRRVPIRLADAVLLEIAALEARARDKKLELSSSVPDEIVVEADPDLLPRVIQNLLDNAVKFTPMGGIVSVSARVDAGQAELSVKDSGAGIPVDEMGTLFDRFHQAQARRAGKLQGTGLGLTFCREALKIMGGDLAASSKPGEGAVFTLRLPLGSAKA
jgi:signal transduction histidine kinase